MKSKLLKIIKHPAFIISCSLGLMIGGYFLGDKIDKFFENRIIIENTSIKDTLEFRDEFLNLLFDMRVEHPYIIYAQAVIESADFTSIIFKENNNMFGMKMPERRTTLAIGVNKGHAAYKTWRDCVIDYALYQSIYLKGLSEDEYFAKLERMYAEDEMYINKIKQMKIRLLKKHKTN